MNQKIITVLIAIILILPNVAQAGWVSGLKTWISNEVLTHTDLNGVVTNLNNGISTQQTATIDSIDARRQTSYPLFWTQAIADSTAANDSLTVEITTKSLIGTKQALYVDNQQGVAETVTFIIDGFVENKYATLDSIQFQLWTETTNDSDFVTFPF